MKTRTTGFIIIIAWLIACGVQDSTAKRSGSIRSSENVPNEGSYIQGGVAGFTELLIGNGGLSMSGAIYSPLDPTGAEESNMVGDQAYNDGRYELKGEAAVGNFVVDNDTDPAVIDISADSIMMTSSKNTLNGWTVINDDIDLHGVSLNLNGIRVYQPLDPTGIDAANMVGDQAYNDGRYAPKGEAAVGNFVVDHDTDPAVIDIIATDDIDMTAGGEIFIDSIIPVASFQAGIKLRAVDNIDIDSIGEGVNISGTRINLYPDDNIYLAGDVRMLAGKTFNFNESTLLNPLDPTGIDELDMVGDTRFNDARYINKGDPIYDSGGIYMSANIFMRDNAIRSPLAPIAGDPGTNMVGDRAYNDFRYAFKGDLPLGDFVVDATPGLESVLIDSEVTISDFLWVSNSVDHAIRYIGGELLYEPNLDVGHNSIQAKRLFSARDTEDSTITNPLILASEGGANIEMYGSGLMVLDGQKIAIRYDSGYANNSNVFENGTGGDSGVSYLLLADTNGVSIGDATSVTYPLQIYDDHWGEEVQVPLEDRFALIVDTNGNVGVHTTTPEATLHVDGNIWVSNTVDHTSRYVDGSAHRVPSLDLGSEGMLATKYIMGPDDSDEVVEALHLVAEGGAAISMYGRGITNDPFAHPSRFLSMSADVLSFSRGSGVYNNSNVYLKGQVDGDTSKTKLRIDEEGTTVGNVGSWNPRYPFSVYDTHWGSDTLLLEADRYALTVDTNGNVGVQTTEPQADFHVAGDTIVEGTISIGDSLEIYNSYGENYITTDERILIESTKPDSGVDYGINVLANDRIEIISAQDGVTIQSVTGTAQLKGSSIYLWGDTTIFNDLTMTAGDVLNLAESSLLNPLDPTGAEEVNMVGDQEYNDARYALKNAVVAESDPFYNADKISIVMNESGGGALRIADYANIELGLNEISYFSITDGGMTIDKPLYMNNNPLYNVLDPTDDATGLTMVGDKAYNDGRYAMIGSGIGGTIDMENNALLNPLDPTGVDEPNMVGDQEYNDARYVNILDQEIPEQSVADYIDLQLANIPQSGDLLMGSYTNAY